MDEPAKKETQIIAIYGKGGIGKSFIARQSQLHDGAAGQARSPDRLRPQERYNIPAVRGRACPTIIETSTKKKLAGDQVSIGDVCFKRDGVFAMELAPGSRSRMWRPWHHPRLRERWRNWAFMTGASTTCCSTSSATWSAAASVCRLRANMPEGDRCRIERSAIALRVRTTFAQRSNISASLVAMLASAGFSHQQGRWHWRSAGFCESGRHSHPPRRSRR